MDDRPLALRALRQCKRCTRCEVAYARGDPWPRTADWHRVHSRVAVERRLLALAEIASLEDDAAEIVPDLPTSCGRAKHDDVAADALLRLTKMLARHDCFQPEIAAWLATAPKDIATSFVFDHGIHRMQDELARVMAKIVPSISPMLLSQTVTSMYSLEVGREPFRPWLSSLAARKDDVGDLARRVLASWT